ncbi:MAG: hypothetical protein FWF06_01590 [Symbiobacteriaceae bacterium]|nr:hypothetical protein [Symbiobacteriaceae bacterium]
MARVSYSLSLLTFCQQGEWAYEHGATLKTFYSLEEAEDALPSFVADSVKIYCLNRGNAPGELDIRGSVREEALRTYAIVSSENKVTYISIHEIIGRG